MSDEINNALVKDKDLMELMKNWLPRYTLFVFTEVVYIRWFHKKQWRT